jgi:hypothetical protein
MSYKVPIARVSKVLDKHNLVATADDLSDFSSGNEVMVLGIGGMLAEGIPLVVPKAKLRVAENAGLYLLLHYEGEIEEREVEIPSEMFGVSSLFKTRTERRKIRVSKGLNVEERGLTGNPGSEPIRVGDVVIYSGSYQTFVRQLAAEAKEKGATP